MENVEIVSKLVSLNLLILKLNLLGIFLSYILFRFATEAAITILRIDDMIKLAPKSEDMQQRR